ncbi:hypothetical protein NM208_g3213 [Fusarium decemcellulare]|uniref:Uncharacterized protein n=2 Tax=Fusarium decemcellulare TaxID=57161 RepID=A0ACC1SM53_9HYPO|nr:hypothetical protein NM208_g4048 [Fusarium decemcellulare]KAJ3544153.1 hypothetical protein NM208_g3213 [Fusarium decemcellulare]
MENSNPAMPEEDEVEEVENADENSQLDHGTRSDSSGTRWLCSSCEQLNLSVDQFIVLDDKDSNFPSSSSPNSVKGTADGDLQLNSGNTKRAFITFGQLRKRPGDCRLCSLIRQAISRHSPDGVEPETALFFAWEVDQRQIIESDSPVNCTRRINLSWHSKSGKYEDIYLVFVAPNNSSQENTNPYLGRILANPTETLDLMKNWIGECSGKHGANCQAKNGNREDFQKLVESTYFGVVDLSDMQLKSLPMVGNDPERYVALSYVWGQRPLDDWSCTTRSNVMIRIQRRGLDKAWDQLPKTIQDVLLLVKAMGERYVWIDSLCIVQDSNTSWELNARAMHLVYGNAHFTICAADGDSTTGLMALNTILPSEQPRATTEAGSLERDHLPLSAECLPGIRLIALRPPESIAQDSVWDHRGWTFQEQLLSPRCLIFAEGQVFFQCRSTTMSQAISTDEDTNRWSLDWTNSPLRTLDELRQRAFWFYMKCIELYTGRDLTNEKDILMAFQGTSWLLKQHLNAPLFYGLPTSHFDLALLWMPLQSLSRRKPKTQRPSGSHGTCSQDGNELCNCSHGRDDWGGKEFPSWSWCGWTGGKTAFQHDMLDGSLLDVQEWLRHHTWILWYARDYEGNLRPLWDRTVLDEDLSEETRWRGYAGQNSSSPDQPTESSPENPAPTTRIDSSQLPPTIPGSEGIVQDDRETKTTAVDEWSRQSNETYLSQIPAGYYDWGTRSTNREIDTDDPGGASKKRKKKKKRIAKPSTPAEETQLVKPTTENEEAAGEEQDNPWAKWGKTESAPQKQQQTIDSYGRPIRSDIQQGTEFTSILPDNPFGVARGPFLAEEKDWDKALPILQFWTWRTELSVSIRQVDTTSTSTSTPNNSSGAKDMVPDILCQCDVLDKAGAWCGSILVSRQWITERESVPFMFIALYYV